MRPVRNGDADQPFTRPLYFPYDFDVRRNLPCLRLRRPRFCAPCDAFVAAAAAEAAFEAARRAFAAALFAAFFDDGLAFFALLVAFVAAFFALLAWLRALLAALLATFFDVAFFALLAAFAAAAACLLALLAALLAPFAVAFFDVVFFYVVLEAAFAVTLPPFTVVRRDRVFRGAGAAIDPTRRRADARLDASRSISSLDITRAEEDLALRRIARRRAVRL